MRNAIFVLAICLILVGLIARSVDPGEPDGGAGRPVVAPVAPVAASTSPPAEHVARPPKRSETVVAEDGGIVGGAFRAPIRPRETQTEIAGDVPASHSPAVRAPAIAASAARTVAGASAPDVAPPVGTTALPVTRGAPAPPVPVLDAEPPPARPVARPRDAPRAPAVGPARAPNAQARAGPPAVRATAEPPAKGPPVRDTQILLSRLGHNAGDADGETGPRTVSAVRAYQVSRGLPVDGRITPQLVVTLRRDLDARLAGAGSRAVQPAAARTGEEQLGWMASTYRRLGRLLTGRSDAPAPAADLRD
jgi:hypothetical protein